MQDAVTQHMSPEYYVKGDRPKILELTRRAPTNTDLEPVTEYDLGYNMKRYWGRF